MKKLLVIAAIALGACTANAQSSAVSVSDMKSEYTLNTDTVTNAATVYMTVTTTAAWANISVQPIITKISGTVAGTYYLQGSIDGTNYVSIVGDSATATNVTTNTIVFTADPIYKYYRVGYTGSGTMSAILRSKFRVQNQYK